MAKRRITGKPRICVPVLLLLALPLGASAQAPANRGTISGTVTADQGVVRGFRVAAHNLDYHVWYTVFTADGHYRVPQALPGSYEISVVEESYASAVGKVVLAPGQSATVGLALTKSASPADISYVEFDQLYPPGPGRDLMQKNCIGCHQDYFHRLHRTPESWRESIHLMRWGNTERLGPYRALEHTQLSMAEENQIVQYLAQNFGADSPKRELKHDPYTLDEKQLSKAIYVQYELPEQSLRPKHGPIDLFHPLIASDKTVYFTVPSSDAVIRLFPRELDSSKRWKVYKSIAEDSGPHGLTEDAKGRIYFAEEFAGKLGVIDPRTDAVTEVTIPTPGTVNPMLTDALGNVWYAQMPGNMLGTVDAQTGKVYDWATPTMDSALYGLTADQKGNIWVAGMAKHILIRFDPVAVVFTEYKTPTPFSGPRHLRTDSKGTVWFTENGGRRLGSIVPETGRITEYKLPMRSATPVELWFDKQDENIVWLSDLSYNMFVKFNVKTGSVTQYPLPQLRFMLAKTEVEPNNTVWLVTPPTVKFQGAVHFYPQGYSENAPPEP